MTDILRQHPAAIDEGFDNLPLLELLDWFRIRLRANLIWRMV